MPGMRGRVDRGGAGREGGESHGVSLEMFETSWLDKSVELNGIKDSAVFMGTGR
jgi:hypothetical protein